MARKRMIAPQIWEDPGFNKLSIGARLLFVGIVSNADDEGFIRADKGSLKRLIFGFDDNVPDLGTWISELQFQKNIHFYEVNEEMYAHLIKWNKYQKQQKDRIQLSIYPPCSKCVADAKQPITEVRLGKEKVGKDKKDSSEAEISKKEKLPRKPNQIALVVDYFFQVKGWTTDSKKDLVYSRYVRPAKDLLVLCDDSLDEAKECIDKIAAWAKSRDLDWGLETIFKKWYEIDFLKPKEKKPHWDGCRIFRKTPTGRWYIVRDGEIKELGRELEPSEITWK